MRHIAVTHPPRKSTSLSRRSFYAPRGLLCHAWYSALRGLLCPARLIVPCAVYCALRGLLCFVRSVLPCAVFCPARFTAPCAVFCPARFIMLCAVYCALRGLLCRNVHICRGAPKLFVCGKAFRAPRGHTARILHGRARGLVRVMPTSKYYPPCGNHGCGKGRKGHKKPPRSDLTPLRRGSDGNYGVGFSRRLLWTVYCFTLLLPQALPRFCVPRGRTYLPPPLTSRLCR